MRTKLPLAERRGWGVGGGGCVERDGCWAGDVVVVVLVVMEEGGGEEEEEVVVALSCWSIFVVTCVCEK